MKLQEAQSSSSCLMLQSSVAAINYISISDKRSKREACWASGMIAWHDNDANPKWYSVSKFRFYIGCGTELSKELGESGQIWQENVVFSLICIFSKSQFLTTVD